MQKTEGSITEYHDGYKVENMLFTYTEEERQRNKINENNASLIMLADFYIIYNSQLSMNTNLAEDRILGFLYYRTKNGKYIYVKNEDLQKLIKGSEATVSRTLKSLEDKGYIDMIVKRIVGAGTDRKLRLSHTALILMSQSRQIDDSESSNGGAIKEYIKRIEENNMSQKCDDSNKSKKKIGIENKSHLLQDYNFLDEFYNMENGNVAYQFRKNKDYIEKEKYKVDELIRLDGYTKEQIEQMLTFIKNDEFRSDKILSVEKLRRKSPQTGVPYHIMIQERMKKKSQKPNTINRH